MAFAAARSIVRVPQVSRPLLARTHVPASVWPRIAGPRGVTGVRTFAAQDSADSKQQFLARLNDYHSEVLSTNWADYLALVYSGPFWEAEFEKLTTAVQPYLHEAAVAEKFAETQELMDVLYKCEDVRDHLNELAEMKTRASGFMGTGFAPAPQIENMDEHAKLCAEAYTALLEKHPNFKPKIEQTVGHGLAILRSKHKFRFAADHRYFY
mmetsp:Transcript_102307/g.161622  ORF Transcript_102307/g.161622 Transcript_102307/m.161622 type:complete len:210 (+) Transcript_102307:52-681(+)|eukprot:CAMPEP_0169142792 /NCGR_PEP_ID=MMETSP1015-20121227/45177_1 /TAXON_ID=342587 /ORGANISM="Karlodinium micrum, Strain CCMP2283" /LENGTH=209 /DNA_ID=CAMNT_0009209559 /DNA_START=58 /DNA_END=687 /DNA_ORIENTATION=+